MAYSMDANEGPGRCRCIRTMSRPITGSLSAWRLACRTRPARRLFCAGAPGRSAAIKRRTQAGDGWRGIAESGRVGHRRPAGRRRGVAGADEADAAIVIPRGQIHLPRHSAVTVIVAPREGVRLDHWKIDGASFVGMQRHTAEWPVQLLMDKSHAVDIYLDIQACVVPAPRCQPRPPSTCSRAQAPACRGRTWCRPAGQRRWRLSLPAGGGGPSRRVAGRWRGEGVGTRHPSSRIVIHRTAGIGSDSQASGLRPGDRADSHG
ncbi:Uncharacterised protein [Chromobacterium violaceum]|uniref:Bacterial repeat domain-containing protein n=1 Tax=Chromobacterium violaceum TaxID=536 RepID=A0A447TEV3_CHRVL|nr:Uncharacterised protein [Chromobacterium violaceum]